MISGINNLEEFEYLGRLLLLFNKIFLIILIIFILVKSFLYIFFLEFLINTMLSGFSTILKVLLPFLIVTFVGVFFLSAFSFEIKNKSCSLNFICKFPFSNS